MSKLVIFGAHGKVGQQLVRLIAEKSSLYTATAVVRNQEQAQQIKSISSDSPNLSTANLTVDNATVQEIADTIKGHDAVVFTAGSGGKNLLQVDLDGAVKTFEASVAANVKRFIIVSAVHADKREYGAKSPIRNYYIAKHYADRILAHEFKDKLDFTILKPTHLTDDPPTGKIKFLTDDNVGSVTRADVAKVIYEIIDNKSTFGKSYDFANGDLSVTDPAIYK
ncbi:hypothetical protein SBY92_004316 [Candida maltosa Xu316]|uniref:NAD(P)-binding domain-containing protein n=1 Tax=Candida maltosa (strain Xu316) TaxID=1245528 RepID=M3JT06_CANMX|nr:hypothetical protein G210_3808 [Candida maltosa Xu316]